jgi:DNA ligase (NAD+)
LEKIYKSVGEKKEKKISFREKTVENILKGIQNSQNVPFSRVLYALGIRYVGETVAKKLAVHYRSVEKLKNATFEELVLVDEIGEKIAQSILQWFSSRNNLLIIENLRKAGVQMEMKEIQTLLSDKLKGQSIVVSGNFGTPARRKKIELLIEQHGGKNAGSVNSKTTFVIAGENMGPEKRKKSNDLGIPVISEQEFLQMLST